MTPPFTGRCLCGAVTYRCTEPPLWQGHCQSESCRRATASPFTSFFGIRNGAGAWSGTPPATYASSPGVWRDFCPTCGTQMTYRATRFPDETHFYAATLDDPTQFTPAGHYHADERLPWVHLADGLPLE
ncbi:GFA family protein [Tabrizicola sp.]|uniref:GFA family protein n=1 Tax=Tabrizicola sp. TaxID=2005166 RepID=UPI00286C664C|nr:GFA family protein [Tabrizicola sp.]